MKYYAFEYLGSKSTTTGSPNTITGRMSIAGNLEVFTTKEARSQWIDAGSSWNRRREAVSKKQARSLCLGMSVADYNDYINYLAED